MNVATVERFSDGRPDEAEQARLASTVGAVLRSARTSAGLSCRQLAARAGCAASSVSRLERGVRRPRPSLLSVLAAQLDPGGEAGLAAKLIWATGTSLRDDTKAGLRARRRRTRRVEKKVAAERWAAEQEHRRRLLEARRADMQTERTLMRMLRGSRRRAGW